MGTLSELTKAQRIEKALEVFAMMTVDPKMTQKKACESVGIDPGTYRYWIAQSGDAIAAFRETRRENERIELVQILLSKNAIMDQLIKDALARTTAPIERLSIKQYLDHREDELADRHRSSATDDVKDFLQGPSLASGENRFGPSEQIVITRQETTTITRGQSPQIIDGQTLDQLPTQSSPTPIALEDRLDPREIGPG